MGPHIHLLEREQVVRRPLSDVFAFFADAANLEALTPPVLNFKILTPSPIAMRAGALIEYELSFLGVTLRWKTLIESFEPERRFVDVQLSGPYRFWRHEHAFVAVPEGTLVRDRVTYELPWGAFGEVGGAFFVSRALRKIFDYRQQAMRKLEQAR